MGRREDPRFRHCYLNAFREHDYRRERTTEDDRAATERRRRIEDIREAARLERDVLNEVWDP